MEQDGEKSTQIHPHWKTGVNCHLLDSNPFLFGKGVRTVFDSGVCLTHGKRVLVKHNVEYSWVRSRWRSCPRVGRKTLEETPREDNFYPFDSGPLSFTERSSLSRQSLWTGSSRLRLVVLSIINNSGRTHDLEQGSEMFITEQGRGSLRYRYMIFGCQEIDVKPSGFLRLRFS